MNYEEFKADILRDHRIKNAIKRACHARVHLDPIYFPGEFHGWNEDIIIDLVKGCIKYNRKIECSELGEISIPKNRKQDRVFFYSPMVNYIIKFLISEYIFEKNSISTKVYGGNKEIFSNPRGDVFRFSGIQFRTWQKRELKSKANKWIVAADITDFYRTIDSGVLAQQISDIIKVDCDSSFIALIKRFYKSLSIGDWCDHYIQNIYLSDLDKYLSKTKWSYGRMTDDIRVFCNSIEDAEEAYSIIEREISQLHLTINSDKLFIINPEKKLEESIYRFSINNESDSFNGAIAKFKYSPYIPIESISEFSNENLWTIIRDSSSCSITYEDNYFNELPKSLTLIDELDGNCGFRHKDYDINTILDDIENRKYDPNEEDIENLKLFIRFGYGNYRFYYRVIYTYLQLIEKSKKEEVLSGFDEIFRYNDWSAIGEIHFFYLAKILLIDDNASLLKKLILKNDNFLDIVMTKLCDFAVIGDNGYSNFLWYILENNCIPRDSISLQYQHDVFWIQRLKKYIENEEYWYMSVYCYLKFLQEKFPDSNLVLFFFAESAYYGDHYKESALRKYENLMYDSQLIEEYHINHRIGTCYDLMKKPETAIRHYDLEIEINNNPDTYNNRAILNIMSHNYELAMSDLLEATNLQDKFEFYYNLAGLHFLNERFGDAADYLKKSIKFSKIRWEYKKAYLHELLAILYIKDKQVENSKRETKIYIDYSGQSEYSGLPEVFNYYYDKLLEKPLDSWEFKRIL